MPNLLQPKVGNIDALRLKSSIDRLAAVATTRLAYSPEDIRGRELAMQMMRDATLDVRVDPAGNILGERPGLTDGPSIFFGSHIDTVRNGGRFDGVLGVIAAIECIHVLNSMGHQTRHPLQVVIFENEEGQNYTALSGSRGMVEGLPEEELARADSSGRPLRDAIALVGGDPSRLDRPTLPANGVHAYLELHIEQGGDLESSGKSIGIVEGISGILHVDVSLRGAANHAGTTSMKGRRDALVAAAQLILDVRKLAAEKNLCRVATVGQLSVSPNSPNIIPGEVRLIVELRDIRGERIKAALDVLKATAAQLAVRSGIEIKFAERPLAEPVPAARSIQYALAESCQSQGYGYFHMHSGAGHDAQILGRVAPMGMIFVPSKGGISHSPDEFTSDEDCARGASVLLHTILKLDAMDQVSANGVS